MSKLDDIYSKILSKLSDTDNDDFYNYLHNYYENIENKYEKSEFIEKICSVFMTENNIYYNKTSKIFFNYTNNNFIAMNDDNIIYGILDYISSHKEFKNYFDSNVKNIIKNKIFKNIKENNVFEVIPDSDTIQMINNSLQASLFNEKQIVKIFLICIGNIVIKKNNKLLIFTRSAIKSFLCEINKYISMYFGNNNIFNYFKYKYTNDHESAEKILLPCNNVNSTVFNFNEQFYINLICVSIYYANRYETISNYLNNDSCTDNIIKDIYYFEDDKRGIIINDYCNKFLIKGENQYIFEKEIVLLWKKYIHENDIFINIFTSYSDFVKFLFKKLDCCYDSNNNNNMLNGYYSLETPSIEIFKSFWNQNFEFSDNEYCFEINEILYLFKQNNKNKKHNINETTICSIIQVYYNNFDIINNKIIHNLKCKLWDKKKEINNFIEKNNIDINGNINNIYKIYNKSSNNLKISKKYFSLYINELIKN